MTEHEALEILKMHNGKCSGCDKLCDDLCKPAVEMAIKALTEIQQYRVIEKRLDDMFGGQLPLEHYVDRLDEKLKEPGKPHPVNARILTYEDADMWEAYKAIGTPEECRAALEKQKAKIADLFGDGYADGHLVYDTYECPNCGAHYELDYNRYEYCPNCGQHMKIEYEGDENE